MLNTQCKKQDSFDSHPACGRGESHLVKQAWLVNHSIGHQGTDRELHLGVTKSDQTGKKEERAVLRDLCKGTKTREKTKNKKQYTQKLPASAESWMTEYLGVSPMAMRLHRGRQKAGSEDLWVPCSRI